MKKGILAFQSFGILVLILSNPDSTRAEITGHWNFDGGLEATIGQPIEFLDGPGGFTADGTRFGSTEDFEIAGINGTTANVMEFPKMAAEFEGFFVPTSAGPSEGAVFLNRYTVLMDVLYPAASSNQKRALIQTDLEQDADFAIDSENRVGALFFNGAVIPDRWHRLAFAVDLFEGDISTFLDGEKVVDLDNIVDQVDGRWALDQFFYLFQDNDGETARGFIASLQVHNERLSDGFIQTLGGPTAEGILTGPPPYPFVLSLSPPPESIRSPRPSSNPPRPWIEAVIQDGQTHFDGQSVELYLDENRLAPEILTDTDRWTIRFRPETPLPAGSVHQARLTYRDDGEPPNQFETQWQFGITEYREISSEYVLAPGSASNPGFRIRTAQLPEDSNLVLGVASAVKLLNGTLVNEEGLPPGNEASPGPLPGGAYEAQTINFEEQGFFLGEFFNDREFPGISAFQEHRRLFCVEVLTFLELEAGYHRFGVTTHVNLPDRNDDDGFRVWTGADPRDAFVEAVGEFHRTLQGYRSAPNVTLYNFVAPIAGVYPFRLVYYTGVQDGALLEWFTEDPATGERVLINDPTNERSIQAFQERDSANDPYVAELRPAPGSMGVAPSDPFEALILNGATAVNPSSVRFKLNGEEAIPEIEEIERGVWARHDLNPPAGRETHYRIQLTFEDRADPPKQFVREWEITADTRARSSVAGQWDFDSGDLSATIGMDMRYFDGPDGLTAQNTDFGTTEEFGISNIDGAPARVMRTPGDFPDHQVPLLAYLLEHGIPPNGGGIHVNQYTLIMDLYFNDRVDIVQSFTGLVNLDDPTNTNDADSFVRWFDGGWGQENGGYPPDDPEVVVQKETWHRFIISADLAQNPPQFIKYLDGVRHSNQGDRGIIEGLDGRQSMAPVIVMFGDNDFERARLYANSVQVREGSITAEQAAALGEPKADGIPQYIPGFETPPDLRITRIQRNGDNLIIAWEGGEEAPFQIQQTESLTNPEWTVVETVESTPETTIPADSQKAFFRILKTP